METQASKIFRPQGTGALIMHIVPNSEILKWISYDQRPGKP